MAVVPMCVEKNITHLTKEVSMLKKLISITTLIISLSFTHAYADMLEDVISVRSQWEKIQYQFAEDKKEAAFEKLAADAAKVSASYPKQAEPLIWEAIINATYAGVRGGFGALGLVEKARDLLLEAEKIDPQAMDGSIYTSLGSLYYQVPGWPIGFGDPDKAEEYLLKALKINPNGIDPNYFYGDYLFEQDQYEKAVQVLEKALKAPPRKGREIADKGRREEIKKVLKKAKAEL